LALTLPASGGCSVGIVRSQTQATVFFFNVKLVPTVCAHHSVTFCKSNCWWEMIAHSHGRQRQDSGRRRRDGKGREEHRKEEL
jgi:hypothetical protein